MPRTVSNPATPEYKSSRDVFMKVSFTIFPVLKPILFAACFVIAQYSTTNRGLIDCLTHSEGLRDNRIDRRKLISIWTSKQISIIPPATLRLSTFFGKFPPNSLWNVCLWANCHGNIRRSRLPAVRQFLNPSLQSHLVSKYSAYMTGTIFAIWWHAAWYIDVSE
jgi:hypothetical protein